MTELTRDLKQASRRSSADTARQWWAELAGVAVIKTLEREGSVEVAQRRGNPGALARLRRAATPVESVLDPEARSLVRRIGVNSSQRPERVARLASLLAHVREDDQRNKVAFALGGSEEELRLMKPVRFRRLMLSESDDDLYLALRRAISMLGRKANVRDLSHAWLNWHHPMMGERIRIQWTFAYVGDAKNETETKSETEAK